MQTRQLGPFTVNAIGLGCMSMSHAYGTPDPAEAEKTLLRALEVGYNFLDTAALYGFGKNEELLGRVLQGRRKEFVLASKCGMFKGPDGKRKIDGRPQVLRQTCEEALQRLRTDVIDLYYLHRRDFSVPVEDSIGEMSRLVEEGKVRLLGMSEVSADTLRKAHAVHPLSALQTEYSLWSRNAEIAVLDTCQELGISFVAFSPLARGFLTGKLTDPAAQLEAADIRKFMPRFYPENYPKNLELLKGYKAIADEVGCTGAQLALAWLLQKAPHIIPIPGTRHVAYVEENIKALNVVLTWSHMQQLDQLINQHTVSGERYNAATQEEIDTEQF
ncbi:MAG: aldo/keto reductase [Pseudomonadales bacterium]|jgi:aryl-alcohol dehydrogenase-like predicted oxidoreductase|nr:aldo/keto reductase [Pseudomonadales bacterium]